jgi:hypothetical protein
MTCKTRNNKIVSFAEGLMKSRKPRRIFVLLSFTHGMHTGNIQDYVDYRGKDTTTLNKHSYTLSLYLPHLQNTIRIIKKTNPKNIQQIRLEIK